MNYTHRAINKEGLELIQTFEGFSETPYVCPAGYKTIGFGHKTLENEHFECISYSEAELLLKKDLFFAERSVIRNINNILNDNQFSALVSFTYNLGGGALQRSTIRQKINYGLYQEASDDLLKWIYAKGKILPGLVKRRTAEYRLFNLQ